MCISGTSHVLTGEGFNVTDADNEVKMIHEENKAKMAAMSQEEIFSEQKKLLEMLGMILSIKCMALIYLYKL